MTVRIALVLLAVVFAATAYPWQSPTERWVLGAAAVVVLLTLAWWRGQFLTTLIARRFGVWRRNHSRPKPRPSHRVTGVVRIEGPQGASVPLSLIAGYVDRFGIRCEKVRVTSRDEDGLRTTWISLTLDAATNLAALQARSPSLPLVDAAEVVARRLADHLRETGLQAAIVDTAEAPVPKPVRERWRAVKDSRGAVSAWGIPVDDHLAERLEQVWSHPTETWTAVEFSGTSDHPTIAAMCAFRTPKAPIRMPVSDLTRHWGIQGPLVFRLDPCAHDRLCVPSTPLPTELLQRIDWPVGSVAEFSRT